MACWGGPLIPADVHGGPELRHLDAGLERQHHAGEEAGEEDDAEGFDADLVHLLDEVLAIEGSDEREAQPLTGQGEVFLDGAELLSG